MTEVNFELHVVEHCNQWCRDCAHFSPFFTAMYGVKEYSADEYIPWIDKMKEQGMCFSVISLLGGETFLHSDLGKFIRTLKNRYGIKIRVVTNGFWLSSPGYIKKWEDVFSNADILDFSRYSGTVSRIANYDDKIIELRGMFPLCEIVVRDISVHSIINFLVRPERVEVCCHSSECTTLTADGKLYRCPPAAHARISPAVTKEFLHARDCSAVYDLNAGNHISIEDWKNRNPFDACNYCNFWRRIERKQESAPEYFKIIAKHRKTGEIR